MLPRTELLEHLAEQTRFLCRSAEAFDDGDLAEAKRLALTVRTLVHETGNSHSLLGQITPLSEVQMSCVGIPASLREPPPPGFVSRHDTGPLLMFGADPSSFVARTQTIGITVDFPLWWEEVVYRSADLAVTRRECVLTLSNRGGGSHVDPRPGGTYRAIVVDRNIGWTLHREGEEPSDPDLNNPLPQMMRAITAEVLTSLSRMTV